MYTNDALIAILSRLPEKKLDTCTVWKIIRTYLIPEYELRVADYQRFLLFFFEKSPMLGNIFILSVTWILCWVYISIVRCRTGLHFLWLFSVVIENISIILHDITWYGMIFLVMVLKVWYSMLHLVKDTLKLAVDLAIFHGVQTVANFTDVFAPEKKTTYITFKVFSKV